MLDRFIARARRARAIYDETMWISRMQGGLAYDVYCLEQEYEFYHRPGHSIMPNRGGLWLIVIGQEIRWRAELIWFVFSGKESGCAQE